MTNETKATHTPGPWRYDGHGINASNGERIAKCQTRQWDENGDPVSGFDEDSRLIAAAPELLAAAKLMRMINHQSTRQDVSDACDALDSAIAKAEGRG